MYRTRLSARLKLLKLLKFAAALPPQQVMSLFTSLPNLLRRLNGYLAYNFPHPSPQKDSSVYTTAAATPCPVKQSDSNCKRLEGTVRGSGSRSEQLIQVLGKFTIAFTPKFQLEASTREHPCASAIRLKLSPLELGSASTLNPVQELVVPLSFTPALLFT